MSNFKRFLAVASTLIGGLGLLTGCRSEAYFQTHTPQRAIVRYRSPATMHNPRSLPIYIADGSNQTGESLQWMQVIDAAMWADVVIIGEQHDDAMGHAVQRAVMADVAARCPGPCCALSMEMLERDDQDLTDDYMDGIIDSAAFAKNTFSEKWAGEGSWENWYQPIIDAAKDHDGQVIAANAPRRYVRLARTDGYERLKELPQPRRSLFDLPVPADDAAYRQRFMEFMTEGDGSAASTQPSNQPAASAPAAMASGHSGGLVTPERFDAAFRSQSLWDATMAASIVDAHRSRGAKHIVHLVGQFHSDFHGGTVAQLKARWPSVKLLVISMQREEGGPLRQDDRGRADVVIYTGKPIEAENDEVETTTQPGPVPAMGR